MSDVGAAPLSQAAGLQARTADLARRLAGIVIGGGLGAILWLVVMQDGFQRDFFGRRWSDHDFARALGKLAGGAEGSFRQRGFYATVVIAAVLVAVYGLVASRLPGSWIRHALGMTAVVFLLWGAVFGPIVAAREPTEKGGFFGFEAGGTTWVVVAIASLGFAFVAVRIYRLMSDSDWWVPGRRRVEASATLQAIGVADAEKDALSSLELAEELREKP
jgi:hypothetical protein